MLRTPSVADAKERTEGVMVARVQLYSYSRHRLPRRR